MECEADHPPPHIAKVENEWSYTATPPYTFMALCLTSIRDNFTFHPQYPYSEEKQNNFLTETTNDTTAHKQN
jgi:hypothetical protein